MQCPGLLTRAGHPGSVCLGCPKIPEEKQILSINHHGCTNRQGIVLHSFEFWEWLGPSPNPEPQMPAEGQPSKLSFQRIAIRPATFTLSCMFIFNVSVHITTGRLMIIFSLYNEETEACSRSQSSKEKEPGVPQAPRKAVSFFNIAF